MEKETRPKAAKNTELNQEADNKAEPGAKKTSTLSIVGFILAFLVPIAGIIVSIISLVKINKSGESGKGLSIVGIIIGVLLLPLEIILIIAFISGFNAALNQNSTSQSANTHQGQQAQSTEQSTAKVQYIFDVPALVGKNIDQIRQVLGQPTDGALIEPNAQQKALGVDEWDNTFKVGDTTLLVTYNPSTRKVVNFFADMTDKAKVYALYNLQDNSSAYTVTAVKAIKDPTVITGYKITPK